MAYFTMITRHGMSKDMVDAYTIISETYQTATISKQNLIEMIKSGKNTFTNITVGAKGIESTNGAIDKYTFINGVTNQVEGTPRAVILDRVEKGGKLIGYTVFTQNGQIREMNVTDAASLASKGMISNGKIRHTQEGDIVSAIGGNYPLREIPVEQAPKGELSVELMYFAASINDKSAVKYIGAIISCTSAVSMSKIIDELTESNAKIKASVAKLTGVKDTSSLDIKRMGANSLYGVFGVEVVKEIISKSVKTTSKEQYIPISIIDYNTSTNEESVIILDSLGTLTVNNEGSVVGLKAAKAYANDIKKLFGSYIK